ncbi:MAG: hypothetical protein ACJASF_001709 [Vicingaceae bacterium]|jgi:hypothetical protein
MKYLFILCFFGSVLAYGQPNFISVDLGYQQGNEQLVEAGLNLGIMVKKPVAAELSIGIEDDLNSELIGYKIGIFGYDAVGKSSSRPEAKPIPIIAGFSFISYNTPNSRINAFRPEIGVRSLYRIAQGITTLKLTYGYNFTNTDQAFDGQINEHLLRLSLALRWW